MDRAIRVMTLLITPVFIVHGLLVMLGYLPSTNYISPEITIIILALWVFVGVYHYFSPLKSSGNVISRLIVFEALSLGTVQFVTGFFQPFIIMFVLLFLSAHLYFGYRGLVFSLVGVIFAAIIDVLFRYPAQPDIVPQNLMASIAILIIALILMIIMANQELKRDALAKSQQLERLQYDRVLTIINNLSDATFSTDANGKVQLYNAACLNLLDTNDSLKGKNIDELFTLTTTEDASIKLHDLLIESDRTTRRSDIRHTYGDGEQVRLELTFAPIKSSYGLLKRKKQETGYIIIARDVTKEKSLEEERDEFISVVSHELRTPITIVEGTLSNLQVLLSRAKTPDPSVVHSTVDTAHEQVLYLAKMVNDLSTLSRAERGVADTPEAIDVSDMIHALHHQYEPEAAAKGLTLNLDMVTRPGTIQASRLYTEELLQNFITNAIKYTKEGSVTVIVKKSKGMVTFAVKDTGIGISRGDQARVFQKFYRSEDYRIRETSGTGLGLYVSAKLAHKLGTQINLTSRLNHGSTFSFSMPTVE
jgi:two-component system, OmpR family, phosphate regulon sensor histidine kinase PhoR